MNRINGRRLFPGKCVSILRMGLVALCLAFFTPLQGAAKTSQVDKTKEAMQDAGEDSMEAAGNFFQRLSESSVQNWTRDEIVAWLIMALLVGSAAGMFSSMKTTGLGRLGLFLLGLVGAFVGCMVVRVGSVNYEWGEAVISYEVLAYSFGAALLFIVADRLLRRQMSRSRKKI